MFFIFVPGALALSSIGILLFLERQHRRVFPEMPMLRAEKRDQFCADLLPFLRGTERKNKEMADIMGWNISGIFMGYVRIMAFLISFTLGGMILSTNIQVMICELERNMNVGKSFIELQESGSSDIGEINREVQKMKILETTIPPRVIRENTKNLLMEIQRAQICWGSTLGEVFDQETNRYRIKLIKFYEMKYSIRPWIGNLIIAFLVYLLPIPLGWIKYSLIEQKKREEIIRLYERMLLYGELPPYELRALLLNMLSGALIYRSVLENLLEGIKSGHAESVLSEEIKKQNGEKDWAFLDLLEHLRLFYQTGILSGDGDIERVIERKAKLEEIHRERRRGGKMQLSTVPLGIIVGLGTWYFMLGTMSLSNASILGR